MARSSRIPLSSLASRKVWSLAALATLAALMAVGLDSAEASGRRFAYTYQSLTAPAGSVELEPWTTFRFGRDSFYSRIDQRLEFEFGITDNLQTAWYLNFSALAADVGDARESKFDFKGVSWEWKLKLLDPVADPLGLALYLEPGVGPEEAELEMKLILDKQVGKLLLAFNVVGEVEWEFGKDETERKLVLELDLGVAYLVSPAFSAGIEAVSHNDFPEGQGFHHSALFAGPVLTYSSSAFWATLAVLPQIAALKGADSGGLTLRGHEKVQARLIFGIDL